MSACQSGHMSGCQSGYMSGCPSDHISGYYSGDIGDFCQVISQVVSLVIYAKLLMSGFVMPVLETHLLLPHSGPTWNSI